jgi:ABC-type uncharacterized transport system involved in gliding motility auxiliary subunit
MGILIALYGLIFLLFGFVAVFAGARLVWIYAHFALSAALLLYAATTSMGQLRERLSRSSTRRSARYGGNLIVQTAIAIVILGLAAYLSVRHPVRWDWTEAAVHSLTQASADVIEGIPEGSEVEILAFFAAGSEAGAEGLLEQYTYRSERVRVRFVDPNARPALANRFEIRANGVLIVCAGPCAESPATARVTQATEEEITKAIRSVISSRRNVFVLTGHGEADADDTGASGLSQMKKALEDENLRVDSLLLANLEDVPEEADAVLIAGPDRSLLDRELDALGRFLERGGGVLVLVDPIVVTNLEERLREWGFEVGNDVIVDQQIQLFAGPQLGVQPIVTDYGDHPITADLGGQPTLFQLARSVRGVGDDTDVAELARTSQSSWAETDIELFVAESKVQVDETDLPGPVSLGAARSMASGASDAESDRAGRIVVIGDSDFARNRYVSEFYNADLFLNTVNWLVGEESFITIDRKLPRASMAVLTSQQFQTFRYLALFVAPELILLIGIAIWWRRRT